MKKRIRIRQFKYLNNIIEQDHQRIKGLTQPMPGFKHFYAAYRTVAGVDVMAMLKKGQMKIFAEDKRSTAELFYAFAT